MKTVFFIPEGIGIVKSISKEKEVDSHKQEQKEE